MTQDLLISAQIRALEAQRYTAMLQGDHDEFARLSHPALVYVHSNGVEDSLDSYQHKCRQGLYLYHRIDHTVHGVRLNDNTALAFGEMSASITSHGIDKNIHNRTLSVWLKSAAGWQLFAYQPTPIVQRSNPAPATGEQ